MMNFFIIIIAISLSIFANASSASIKENRYSISSTYQKLVSKYAEISIPSQLIPENIRYIEGIPYKSFVDSEQTLNIYALKAVKAKQPLIMLVHGGGWKSGQTSLMKPLAIGLAQQGYVVSTPSYRLSGQAKYPAAVHDLIDALLWLKAHAKTYNIDNSKVILAGSSAGGQLAALLAYSGGLLKGDVKTNKAFTIQALLNIDGLSDFTSPEALPFENDPKKNPSAAGAWFGGRYEEVPELWQQASPIYYIDKDAPPTLFLNGEKARFHAGRDAAIERLTQLGINSTVVKLDNAPHSFWLLNPWLGPTVTVCTEFLVANGL